MTQRRKADYERGVTNSQLPMPDDRVLSTSSIDGRGNPGVIGDAPGDEGSCACGGSRVVLAVSGVSSPDDGLRLRGGAKFSGCVLSGVTGEFRTLLGSRETVHDGNGSADDPCRILDRLAPGDPGVEYMVAMSRIFSMSSEDSEGVRPRSLFHAATGAFSVSGPPSNPLKLDFGVYMGMGMDGGRRSGVEVGLDGGYRGDGDIDNGVARSRTAFV